MKTPPPLSNSAPVMDDENSKMPLIIGGILGGLFLLTLLLLMSGNRGDSDGTSGGGAMVAESGGAVTNEPEQGIEQQGEGSGAAETGESATQGEGDSGQADVAAPGESMPTPESGLETQDDLQMPDGEFEAFTDGFAPLEPPRGFFGLPGTAGYAIYLIDMSGSMTGEKFEKTKRELVRCLTKASTTKKFGVIGFNANEIHDPSLIDSPNDGPSVESLKQWLMKINPEFGTNPSTAASLAAQLKPDTVYLLSDGEFSGYEKDQVIALLQGTTVHCISLSQGSFTLEEIARQSGGKYIQIN